MEIAPGHEVGCFLHSLEKLRKEISARGRLVERPVKGKCIISIKGREALG